MLAHCADCVHFSQARRACTCACMGALCMHVHYTEACTCALFESTLHVCTLQRIMDLHVHAILGHILAVSLSLDAKTLQSFTSSTKALSYRGQLKRSKRAHEGNLMLCTPPRDSLDFSSKDSRRMHEDIHSGSFMFTQPSL